MIVEHLKAFFKDKIRFSRCVFSKFLTHSVDPKSLWRWPIDQLCSSITFT